LKQVSLLVNDQHHIKRMNIRDNLLRVREQIRDAAIQAGRDPASITLVGVTKQVQQEDAYSAWEEGLEDLAENRVQELLVKQDYWTAGKNDMAGGPRWHLIGTLQRNKVRHVLGKTVLIHSVDSIALLREINKRSIARGIKTACLLQVNSSKEASKHGFKPACVLEAATDAYALPGIQIKGLMTIAQMTPNPDETKPVFEKTRQIFEQVADRLDLSDWTILSMGMSQDFRQAIACGATHVRIGRAIFGSRPV
jgi:PLP dependent protein